MDQPSTEDGQDPSPKYCRKAAQYAANNTELEARLRVLERIVTDKGYDVATQIEALLDARKVDALLQTRNQEPSL